MNDQFSKMIRKMENEVTALKTAHDRGLGTVDFYSKVASASGTFGMFGIITVTITAIVADGELTPAFCQPQITVDNALMINLNTFSQSGNTMVWAFYARGDVDASANTNVKVISASKLASLGVTIK